ncbi:MULTISPECIES: HNH endonuclease signature motif containing protein [unclassified Pseudoalteromonas]|uniref:HNH endonuclease signature motif containing protein n=1 Tax=unclassified Pseudoalteromonas TaxID=194690 RepID=UPI002096FC1B|nr:HNH endonuclease signature motif containing protein [Pseudoalteromonas sp. XMcav2-N]MCO7189518.1 HNH endonuclease [Pseudoalteromonas sp. XMcav2-N]
MNLIVEKQLKGSICQPNNNWDMSIQKELSALKTPDYLIGPRVDILQGDISREWFKWIVDQFVDSRFFEEDINFFKIYESVKESVDILVGGQKDSDDKLSIARLVSEMVEERIKFLISDSKRRKSISKNMKEDLLAIYGPEPRCWLTGVKFTDEAIYNFTAKQEDKVNFDLPVYIDKYRPIGTKSRDLSIEVDHLHPFSLGGVDEIDNYRLICGWANKVKSNHITGYSTGTKVTGRNQLFPNSFYYWVIRTLGLKRKCEVPGCGNSIENSELTVCSNLGSSKAITPVSMKVVCKKHDSRAGRYVKRSELQDPFHV